MTNKQIERIDYIQSIVSQDDAEEKHGYMYEAFVYDLLHIVKALREELESEKKNAVYNSVTTYKQNQPDAW